MDEYLILEFQTIEEAQSCLYTINDIIANFWAGQGYTVVEEEGVRQLVGKNAATGEDEVMNTRTVTWDTIAPSPDGTYYFASLRNDPRYHAEMQKLESFSFTERTFPQEWKATEV